MRYVLTVIWFEYRRYVAAVLAVAAGTALIGLEVGFTIGLVGLVSLPIDRSSADVWVSVRNAPSCDLGAPVPRDWGNRVLAEPNVAAVDEVIQSYVPWTNAERGNVLSVLIGVNLDDSGLGPVGLLTPQQRLLLTEIGSVVIDHSERENLGVRAVGDSGEVYGTRVRVAGFTHGVGSITGPFVLCSLETARFLLRHSGYDSYMTTFVLARCRDRTRADEVVRSLGQHADMSSYSAADFSTKSRLYWLTTTKAGLAIGFITLMGLIIGALVTAQTLYSATLALARELALLRGLGASLGRVMRFVLAQAAVVGLTGVVLGLMAMEVGFRLAAALGTHPYVDWRLRLAAAAAAMAMALASGLVALFSLRRADPVQLLR